MELDAQGTAPEVIQSQEPDQTPELAQKQDRMRRVLFWVGVAVLVCAMLLQLAVNFGWTILFFGLNLRGTALVCLAILWLLVLDMTLTLARVSTAAALLQVPYLLWLSFAAYLNAGIWLLNR